MRLIEPNNTKVNFIPPRSCYQTGMLYLKINVNLFLVLDYCKHYSSYLTYQKIIITCII